MSKKVNFKNNGFEWENKFSVFNEKNSIFAIYAPVRFCKKFDFTKHSYLKIYIEEINRCECEECKKVRAERKKNLEISKKKRIDSKQKHREFMKNYERNKRKGLKI